MQPETCYGLVKRQAFLTVFLSILAAFAAVSCGGEGSRNAESVPVFETSLELMDESDFQLVEEGAFGPNERLSPGPIHKTTVSGPASVSLQVPAASAADENFFYVCWALDNLNVAENADGGASEPWNADDAHWLVFRKLPLDGGGWSELKVISRIEVPAESYNVVERLSMFSTEHGLIVMLADAEWNTQICRSVDRGETFFTDEFHSGSTRYPFELRADSRLWYQTPSGTLAALLPPSEALLEQTGGDAVLTEWNSGSLSLIDAKLFPFPETGFKSFGLPGLAFSADGGVWALARLFNNSLERDAMILLYRAPGEDDFVTVNADLLADYSSETGMGQLGHDIRPRCGGDGKLHVTFGIGGGTSYDLNPAYMRLDGEGRIECTTVVPMEGRRFSYYLSPPIVRDGVVAMSWVERDDDQVDGVSQYRPYGLRYGVSLNGGDTFEESSFALRVNDYYDQSAVIRFSLSPVLDRLNRLHFIWDDNRFMPASYGGVPDLPFYSLHDRFSDLFHQAIPLQ